MAQDLKNFDKSKKAVPSKKSTPLAKRKAKISPEKLLSKANAKKGTSTTKVTKRAKVVSAVKTERKSTPRSASSVSQKKQSKSNSNRN